MIPDAWFLIHEYITPDGKVPFTEWLNALKDRTTRARIRVRLDRLRMGNLGDHKSVGSGVWELRLTFGPGWRIYFGKDGERIILLLTGGDKTSQTQDIALAQQMWADYRNREGTE